MSRIAYSLTVAAALLGAGPLAAMDDVDAYISAYGPELETCFSKVDPNASADCKGVVFQTCAETEEGGYSTLGMVACMAAETRVWDDRLNQEYKQSMAWARALDAADKAHFPEFAKRADSLLAAQRAWIAFRDAECGLDYAVWGAGSMRQIAGASCQMEMTADRTISLRDLRDTMR